MSLISGLGTLPWAGAYALMAVNEARYKAPIEEEPTEGDQGGEEVLRALPGSRQTGTPEMLKFLRRNGVRQDLIFAEEHGLNFGRARGTNIFTRGDAVVSMPPGFSEVDAEARQWLIKHEISHIENNDAFLMWSVSATCQVALSIFGIYYLSFVPATFLANSVGAVTGPLFSMWREARADDFAIANSSIEELKGGRRFLIAARASNIEDLNADDLRRFELSPEGEAKWDFYHPSLASRIRKIEQALSERGIDLSTLAVEEEDKIKRLTVFCVNEKKEMTKVYLKYLGKIFERTVNTAVAVTDRLGITDTIVSALDWIGSRLAR